MFLFFLSAPLTGKDRRVESGATSIVLLFSDED